MLFIYSYYVFKSIIPISIFTRFKLLTRHSFGWRVFYANDEVHMNKTQKGEPFKGTEIFRQSVAVYVTAVFNEPTFDVRASVDLNKSGTDGDKPSFY